MQSNYYIAKMEAIMALVNLKLQSELLSTNVEVDMYFPCDLPAEVGFEPKGTLTLLHGYKGSASAWFSYTAAIRYAADNALVLICPSCSNSFYQDSVIGNYETFITKEMPMLLSRMFVYPKERERNYIAGLSMGGYGALYLGMSHPELYAGCASFSGALDLELFVEKFDQTKKLQMDMLFNTVNDKIPDSKNLYKLIDKIAAMPKENQPKILSTCGYEDMEPYFIKPQNDAFSAYATTLDIANYKHMEWSGDHTWKFWDRSLIYAIDYFFNNDYAKIKHEDWAHKPSIK